MDLSTVHLVTKVLTNLRLLCWLLPRKAGMQFSTPHVHQLTGKAYDGYSAKLVDGEKNN